MRDGILDGKIRSSPIGSANPVTPARSMIFARAYAYAARREDREIENRRLIHVTFAEKAGDESARAPQVHSAPQRVARAVVSNAPRMAASPRDAYGVARA